MKQRIYEDLWRRLGKFAPAKGTVRTLDANGVREYGEITESWTEFDSELDRLAGWIAEIGIESWPPPGPMENYLRQRERFVMREGTLGPPMHEMVRAAHEEAAARGRA